RPVGTERHGLGVGGEPGERGAQAGVGGGGDVPQFHRVVGGGDRDGAAVGGEVDRLRIVAGIEGARLPGVGGVGDVEQADRSVGLVGDGEQPRVGGEGYDGDDPVHHAAGDAQLVRRGGRAHVPQVDPADSGAGGREPSAGGGGALR